VEDGQGGAYKDGAHGALTKSTIDVAFLNKMYPDSRRILLLRQGQMKIVKDRQAGVWTRMACHAPYTARLFFYTHLAPRVPRQWC
jgi:hypothetical protein